VGAGLAARAEECPITQASDSSGPIHEHVECLAAIIEWFLLGSFLDLALR
jgi:hypothetical protein